MARSDAAAGCQPFAKLLQHGVLVSAEAPSQVLCMSFVGCVDLLRLLEAGQQICGMTRDHNVQPRHCALPCNFVVLVSPWTLLFNDLRLG